MLSQIESTPTIVRLADNTNNGIEAVTLSRYAIGYILRGSASVHNGDKCLRMSRGDVFYLGLGNHYIRRMSENGQSFEAIMIYYTADDLRRALTILSTSYDLTVSNAHTCDRCRTTGFISMPAWDDLRAAFESADATLTNKQRCERGYMAENMRIFEIFSEIAVSEDCCLKSKFLGTIDMAKENFERIVVDNIFKDMSIDQLAQLCNRSLTSFKKEFRRRFGMPPHKWIIRQRMQQARLWLISTEKSISEIGYESAFANTSHFIKLFKKEFGLTPAAFRTQHRMLSIPASEEEEQNVVGETLVV